MSKPLSSEKEYRLIKLRNEVQVLMIEDVESTQLELAVSVFFGSWSDPEQYMGLTNLIEHLILDGISIQSKSSLFDLINS